MIKKVYISQNSTIWSDVIEGMVSILPLLPQQIPH
jgi:hypothetical protein